MSASDENERTIVSKAKVEGARDQKAPSALELIKGPGAPRKFMLSNASYLVGREPTVDIHIPSAEMSRRHLRINRVGEEFMFVDQNSANGVYLNGTKTHSAVLRDGDQLQLADVVLIYRERG